MERRARPVSVSGPTAARRRFWWRLAITIRVRLRQFAPVHGGALVESWQLFGTASLFGEAAE